MNRLSRMMQKTKIGGLTAAGVAYIMCLRDVRTFTHREEMENKKMANAKRTTIKDVASVAGVSVATVSRFLNESGYVDDSTKEAIRKAIEQTNYRVNKNAKFLKTRRSNQLMLMVPDIENPYYAEMFKTLQKLAAQKGYSVLLYDSNADTRMELAGLDLMEDLGADGLIYCSTESAQEVQDRLMQLQKPIVVSQRLDGLHFDTLHSIGGRGIYLAARHLIDLGHRRIAYVGGPEGSPVNRRRRNGLLMALEENGLTLPRDLCFEMDFTMDAGYKAGMYIASLTSLPTAICAANDMIAMGVMQALQERGLRVPADISITGEDNIGFARICRPGLTTINNSGSEFSRRAADLLFDRIDGRYDGPPRDVVCPRELVVRESTRAITHDL